MINCVQQQQQIHVFFSHFLLLENRFIYNTSVNLYISAKVNEEINLICEIDT